MRRSPELRSVERNTSGLTGISSRPMPSIKVTGAFLFALGKQVIRGGAARGHTWWVRGRPKSVRCLPLLRLQGYREQNKEDIGRSGDRHFRRWNLQYPDAGEERRADKGARGNLKGWFGVLELLSHRWHWTKARGEKTTTFMWFATISFQLSSSLPKRIERQSSTFLAWRRTKRRIRSWSQMMPGSIRR